MLQRIAYVFCHFQVPRSGNNLLGQMVPVFLLIPPMTWDRVSFPKAPPTEPAVTFLDFPHRWARVSRCTLNMHFPRYTGHWTFFHKCKDLAGRPLPVNRPHLWLLCPWGYRFLLGFRCSLCINVTNPLPVIQTTNSSSCWLLPDLLCWFQLLPGDFRPLATASLYQVTEEFTRAFS